MVSGSIFGGIPSNKITAIAGESSTGKTFFTLSIVRHFLDTDPDAGVIYFESESAISRDMIESRGIDSNRMVIVPVVTVQEFRQQAIKIIDKYLEKVSIFRWRGIGDIPRSGLKLKDAYAAYNAEVVYKEILPNEEINDHKLCICGDILRGAAKPPECTIFGTACKPTTPVGSCMVSSEGACAAYYKYGNLISQLNKK